MNRAKIFTAFTFLLAFAVCASAQKSKIKKVTLSAQDKKEIINQVFKDGFEALFNNSGFTQCLTPVINDRKIIFIKSGIDKNLLPINFEEYSFMIMSSLRINEEVMKNNGECYFKLNGFQTADSKIRVSLTRIIDEIYRFENSSKHTRWISGEGYIYEFEKSDGWKIISSKKVIISS